MEIQPAADTAEDLQQNGPKAILITAETDDERKALAFFYARLEAGFLGALGETPPEPPKLVVPRREKRIKRREG